MGLKAKRVLRGLYYEVYVARCPAVKAGLRRPRGGATLIARITTNVWQTPVEELTVNPQDGRASRGPGEGRAFS